ncbi:hypothetical protein GCM10007931_11520 [Vibrio algivorus]|uniref:Haem-binding uptake Tiki superfamily ChaN domain-containing protein n=2 Tax=Vibrio algivorus TaxID=1667024 RepID=A0ABQ6EMQ5_9VIBR|nr:hypothetical protein GCM10007931_11520 [Vibrio algivorus]
MLPKRLNTPAFGLLTLMLISGCSSLVSSQNNPTSVSSFYDYQLYTPEGDHISLSQWAKNNQTADVILIGEWHTHAGIHRFQTDVLKQFIQNKQNVTLSMEQFSRDSQSVVNSYLNGEIGEQTLIKQANAWPNYESDYRPLVELAKSNQLKIIAANAPKPMVRCISKHGLDYLAKLPQDKRAYVASKIDLSDSPYKQKFMASMHHGKPSQHLNMYASQLTWDATMAESIVNYKHAHPKATVVHIAGKFHTEAGLGTAAQIKQLDPSLNVIIVTPVNTIIKGDNDYQLEVLSPPVRYVKPEHQKAAFSELFKNKTEPDCS